MSRKINIQSKSAFFTVIGFTFLLLLSPCKVRNYIQSELGIPQTEVTNKSQSTISSSNCTNIEDSNSTINYSKSTRKLVSILVVKHSFFNVKIANKLKKIVNHYTSDQPLTSSIPLYILYQNLKTFL